MSAEQQQTKEALTPENAREVFMSAASTYASPFKGQKERQQLLEVLQTKDVTVQNILATCVNERNVTSCFIYGCPKNDIELLQALLKIGVNVNVADYFGESGLIMASKYAQKDTVRWLLDHDANVDSQDMHGNTALMRVAQNGCVTVVKMFLEKNANPDMQETNGWTALMIASMSGHAEIAELLLNHGVNIDLKDNEGKTALDLAEDGEVKEMIRNYVSNSYVLK